MSENAPLPLGDPSSNTSAEVIAHLAGESLLMHEVFQGELSVGEVFREYSDEAFAKAANRQGWKGLMQDAGQSD